MLFASLARSRCSPTTGSTAPVSALAGARLSPCALVVVAAEALATSPRMSPQAASRSPWLSSDFFADRVDVGGILDGIGALDRRARTMSRRISSRSSADSPQPRGHSKVPIRPLPCRSSLGRSGSASPTFSSARSVGRRRRGHVLRPRVRCCGARRGSGRTRSRRLGCVRLLASRRRWRSRASVGSFSLLDEGDWVWSLIGLSRARLCGGWRSCATLGCAVLGAVGLVATATFALIGETGRVRRFDSLRRRDRPSLADRLPVHPRRPILDRPRGLRPSRRGRGNGCRPAAGRSDTTCPNLHFA